MQDSEFDETIDAAVTVIAKGDLNETERSANLIIACDAIADAVAKTFAETLPDLGVQFLILARAPSLGASGVLATNARVAAAQMLQQAAEGFITAAERHKRSGH